MKRSDISTYTVLKSAECVHTTHRFLKMMTWEFIRKKTKYPEKVIYAAIEREFNRGYLEYGVSLRTAWLTNKGKNKLKEILDNAKKTV